MSLLQRLNERTVLQIKLNLLHHHYPSHYQDCQTWIFKFFHHGRATFFLFLFISSDTSSQSARMSMWNTAVSIIVYLLMILIYYIYELLKQLFDNFTFLLQIANLSFNLQILIRKWYDFIDFLCSSDTSIPPHTTVSVTPSAKVAFKLLLFVLAVGPTRLSYNYFSCFEFPHWYNSVSFRLNYDSYDITQLVISQAFKLPLMSII
jgi:hypothetical protein